MERVARACGARSGARRSAVRITASVAVRAAISSPCSRSTSPMPWIRPQGARRWQPNSSQAGQPRRCRLHAPSSSRNRSASAISCCQACCGIAARRRHGGEARDTVGPGRNHLVGQCASAASAAAAACASPGRCMAADDRSPPPCAAGVPGRRSSGSGSGADSRSRSPWSAIAPPARRTASMRGRRSWLRHPAGRRASRLAMPMPRARNAARWAVPLVSFGWRAGQFLARRARRIPERFSRRWSVWAVWSVLES